MLSATASTVSTVHEGAVDESFAPPCVSPEELSGAVRHGFPVGPFVVVALIFFVFLGSGTVNAEETLIRVNQVGFRSEDPKSALMISKSEWGGEFLVVDALTESPVFVGTIRGDSKPNWGSPFPFTYILDFSDLRAEGRFYLKFERATSESPRFTIGDYAAVQEDLLFFVRQQRCGYNPFLDMVCHQRDGRTFYAPIPDGSFGDASGGWHDAGDQLKYLITASNATARMLLAYELERAKFADRVDDYGRPRPNGIADVLDEAKWGLDWIEKLHPKPDWLFHQVADDRDHRGFKLPDQDNADYGWGKNSYRPVYFADGKPQGLRDFKSRSTGVANIAGRSAAAFAMASRIWRADLKDPSKADVYLKHAIDLYALGKAKEGFQQGNSYGAPYRYNEDTWADDMEWAAAELFKATRRKEYLDDAKRYAKRIGATSWMGRDTAEHYQLYPFMNVGHFALYPLVDFRTKRELAGYYRENLEAVSKRASGNSYGIGVPFIWCSNNLVVNLVTQAMLYEQMTGDRRFREIAIAHRDWLFGRNPWGTSMFEGIPAGGEFPEDTHLPTVQSLKKQATGGLVDGPIQAATYNGLIGIRLNQPDEFAAVQPKEIVYHDDVGDYSTNEPTMDGTADAILMTAAWSGTEKSDPRFRYDQGAIVRGDATKKQLALVFTGDEFADGADKIAATLLKNKVKASFFFTGRFYRSFGSVIERLKRDGHYLGAHSDGHLLYADWNDRSKTLISRQDLELDLARNYAEMKRFGFGRDDAPYFLPPFEWYNRKVAEWTSELGLKLINFTPGTGSNADYTTPSMKNYQSSDAIERKILDYESKNGLNGFILLIHIGTDPERTDKFYDRLDALIGILRSKGYRMVGIETLLR
ncbi:MAG: glycoside hydrolase family 9 protein [Acidobacteria bacterium]|nr:glycoside hydrolase family 9 protein [Acidobacteriota bacterium]